jgi:glycosyl transferase family 25
VESQRNRFKPGSLSAVLINMNSLAKYFDAAYLINLAERTDRLDWATAELARVGWDFSPHGVQLFPARKFSDRAGFPSAGSRGAFQSHWECLQRGFAEGHRGVLILEDDITFSSALVRLTPSIMRWLEVNEWDFVYFGHYQTGPIPNATSRTKSEELRFNLWGGDIQGLHFYGVNGRILGRLNAHLERVANGAEGDQETGPMPVDGAINNFRRMNPDIQTLIANPKLGWQKPSRSDIMPGKLDQFRVLRPLTDAFRNMKHIAKAWRS